MQFADAINQMISVKVQSFRISLMGIADAVTAGAKLRGEEFPHVTLPSFEIPANNLRQQAGVEFILYAPLVENKSVWQDYATHNIGWVNLSRSFQSFQKGFEGAPFEGDAKLAPFIWILSAEGTFMESQASRYLPIWHASPPSYLPERFLNRDLLADPSSRGLFEAALSVEGIPTSRSLQDTMSVKY